MQGLGSSAARLGGVLAGGFAIASVVMPVIPAAGLDESESPIVGEPEKTPVILIFHSLLLSSQSVSGLYPRRQEPSRRYI